MEQHVNAQANPMEILRMPAVLGMTKLSRTTLWRRIREGEFPRPVRLGGARSRAVGWHRSEIEEWLRGRPAA
ncbi:helix-turn-helix transcriptional regulator [Candidatus Palauibacter sp.]|uniref:helix-turn-helix transcriptional regulator n=1 Tax=Candidatus Palauibacter sp. TaxID=3101350 RepID=UPI003B5951FD